MRNPTVRKNFSRSIFGVVAFVAISAIAHAAPRLYRNEAMRVRAFDPPMGWELAPQVTYPGLLATYTHQDGGRLTLAAQRVAANVDAKQLADQSKPVLERQGFGTIKITPEEGGLRLDAILDGGKRLVRQHYRVAAPFGYVVTMIVPSDKASRHQREFEDALRSLNLVGGDGK